MRFFFVDPEIYKKHKDEVLRLSDSVQINFQEQLLEQERRRVPVRSRDRRRSSASTSAPCARSAWSPSATPTTRGVGEGDRVQGQGLPGVVLARVLKRPDLREP